ncbi:HtaA domain-containing protein [Rhodococcus sp. T7]|uniref:HtaA domain-containing protein n=1 Tax=Rhodococcus sp. T7 TaxID=627444 RepID=UPI00135C58BB|nr:HtaA domain-containing protein [Rhodococcus sp. T7]KAF0956797.1 hypothetical protein MLGJGCBP_09877 [Rhodococcus sp. T7]KAF0966084.1 hypothetical protein MLGJGCBP_00768 [Rhodococcus sp. T7]
MSVVDATLPGLRWGIKASFLDYIARMPDGRGTVSDGARPTEHNEMVFEPAPEVAAPAGVDRFMAFRGDVRFGGHFGMLFVRIADPWVTVRGRTADLTVLDPHHPEVEARLHLVTFTLDSSTQSGTITWTGSDVRLTPDGAGLFNDVYPPGEPFEPITIVLAASSPVVTAFARDLHDPPN